MSVSLEESADKGRPDLAGRRIGPEGRGPEFSFSEAFGETVNPCGLALIRLSAALHRIAEKAMDGLTCRSRPNVSTPSAG
ncbi:hypothetical protein [Nonomuraea dietziae]|uniref:hypothetical protein n=1 Tax=Nonomuraea dietziae TaxID=65515 RepID=UPI003415919D